MNPSTVVSGTSTVGKVTLSQAAPAGGATIDLASSLSSGAVVPTSIVIAAGSTSGTFSVETVTHSRTLIYTITASNAINSQKANLTALGDSIASLSLAPSTVVSGQNSTGTVTLLYPAPAFGWTVNLSTSSSTYGSVPSSVTIPAGSSSGTFTVKTVAHGRTLTTTIKAVDQTSGKTVTLTALGDAVSSLALLPNTVKGGEVTGGTITLLYPAPAFGWTVNLSSTGASVLTAPSITIPAGVSKGSFSIYTTISSGNANATIIASDQTSTQKQVLTTTPGFWLANTPWPKFRGSLQNQGQATGHGASGGQRWKFGTGGEVWSSPAIGRNGDLYIGSDDHNLYALNADGTVSWKYTTEGPVRSSPAVGSDETIYVGGGNSLYAITSFGTLIWKYTTAGPINSSSPTIQSSGTISFGSSTGFYELTHAGALLYHWPSGDYQITGSPALWGDDLYAGILSNLNDLFSFGSGSENWSFPLPVSGSAAVGADGTIYVGSSGLSTNSLHAIFPNGKSDWYHNVTGSIESSPAVGLDGTIYVASTAALYAFNPDGSLKWSNPVGGSHGSSPTVDSAGTIYVGLAVGSSNNGLYAFNPNGTIKWKFPTESLVYSSPAIGADGSLYFGCLDGNVYAIEGPFTHSFRFSRSSDTIQLTGGSLDGVCTLGNAFTVEVFLRPTNLTGEQYIWQQWSPGDFNEFINLESGVFNAFSFYDENNHFYSGSELNLNRWNHLAWVYDGTHVSTYQNGKLTSTTTVANGFDYVDPGTLCHLGSNAALNSFLGDLAGLRISSVARYSGTSFTPPSGPFLSDGSTLLLIDPSAFSSAPGSFAAPGSAGLTAKLGTGFSGSTSPTLVPYTP